MSDTKNGSHESIDTSPLRPDQLSDHELSIILSIEDRLKLQQASAPTAGKNQKPYLARIQVRRPQVLLLDGPRGTGKTSLLLTMAHRWNRHDSCDVPRGDSDDVQYQRRVGRIQKRLQIKHDGTLPMHLHPLRILDFDPLPPQMPLIAGIIQAWQPLAEAYDALSKRSKGCDDEAETLQDRWNNLFRVAAVGWSPVPRARGLLEHVLDRQEQVIEWQRLGQRWYEFVRKVIACGKCLRDPHKLLCEPMFVIMIDDVDLQVERIRELLPALRLLYHPNVAFLVAAHWEHLIDTLGLDFLGQQNRLANRPTDRNAWSAADDDKWAGTLAIAAASKVFPLRNRWALRGLTLHELLAFPNYGDSVDKPEKRDANADGTMRTILNEWPRVSEKKKLGDYLHEMAGCQNDPYEIPPFITYRRAHQILESASMQGEERAGAKEAVRLLLSEPRSEAVAFEKGGKREPLVEYRGDGQLAALFPPEFSEETLASSRIVLGARPGFVYRRQPSADAISMHGYAGSKVNFTAAMLAVTIKEGLFGVAARGLQWNVQLALVWTSIEASDAKSLLKLAFQWQFHEHPHPFRLLKWSHEWRKVVRTIQDNREHRVDRIAYAWIFQQLEWLHADLNGLPGPAQTANNSPEHWDLLLDVKPKPSEDTTHEGVRVQDWRTQTLPLLARPEIGLNPEAQRKLLKFVESERNPQIKKGQREWLKDQRRRLVTDAIIAAGEQEGIREKNAEDEERVQKIVEGFDRQHKASPWCEVVEEPRDIPR